VQTIRDLKHDGDDAIRIADSSRERNRPVAVIAMAACGLPGSCRTKRRTVT
jgi:hypothetical protein